MKGQSYILEYIIMFGIAFMIFSTVSYLFYSQTEFLTDKVKENSAKLVNKAMLMYIIKSNSCKNCDMIIYQKIPQKIGGEVYSIVFTKNNIQVNFLLKKINSTTYNFNETFDFSGAATSNNKKVEIKINNRKIMVN